MKSHSVTIQMKANTVSKANKTHGLMMLMLNVGKKFSIW